MAYATVNDVQERMMREMSTSCRMVERAVGDGTEAGIPMGATQGSMSALGYSQSWTIGSGATGELYLSKIEKKLLGAGNAIGSYSPTQELVPEGGGF